MSPATTATTSGYIGSTVSGGDGNDTIAGFSSSSLLLGGLGADSIELNAGGIGVTPLRALLEELDRQSASLDLAEDLF